MQVEGNLLTLIYTEEVIIIRKGRDGNKKILTNHKESHLFTDSILQIILHGSYVTAQSNNNSSITSLHALYCKTCI